MEIELNFRILLRTALIAQWLILIVSVFVSMDATLRDDIGILESLRSILFGIALIISWMGLFFIEPWAIWLYTILFAIDIVSTLFSEPLIKQQSNFANVMGYLATISTVILVILCVLFLVNFRNFRKQITGES